MYKDYIRVLKPLSSEEDLLFQQHFLETKYMGKLLEMESDIVFGPKGSGKTALSMALTGIHSSNYFTTGTLDLENLSINKLLGNFKKVEKTINENIRKISRIAWMNTLLNFGIFILEKELDDLKLKNQINNILKADGFISDGSHINSAERINNFAERILNVITKIPYTTTKKTLGNIPTEHFNIINQFPLNKTTSLILDSLIEKVCQSDKKILISIDGLDSVIDPTNEARDIIFSGLIDAIYHIRLDKRISSAFIFKCFLPQEFTIDANDKIWDADKHIHNVHEIRWHKQDFEKFLLKRFNKYSKTKSDKFEVLWKEIFPEKVINPIYNVEENTFDYILRHTLYRPRQLQDHIYFIMREWSERTGGERIIQASFIPGAISRNSDNLSKITANQLSKIHYSIISFLRSWQKSNSTQTVEVFRDRISRIFVADSGQMDYKKVNRVFNDLYSFGIFGIACDNRDPDFKTKMKDFHFSFTNEYRISDIHTTTKGNDLIAFAPMFREYCGIRKNNDYIVRPVKKDNFL